uniref:DUF3730 domain-containing protein n=1 Tax=Mesocestoides corti TaxID=53468 RepID=A0A5K3F9A0_MESCO
MDVKLAILDTLGNLSLHNADNSTVFPDVLKSLIDIFTSEVNEDIIESVLIQLGMWIKRPKCVLPEKAQATIRDKLFAAKTSHRVKMAIFRCIEEVLRSGGKLSKTYIPLLATMAQGAKTEVPTSPLVSQAVAAASLWLMNVSQPGKAPECMWAVLSGLKADGKPANEKESLPMWLSDRFLLTASSDVHSYLVNCIHLLLTNHPNELSRHQRSVFYRSLILVWLYTESVNVVSDIRCCLLLHLAREGKQTRTLGQALIEDHLNALVQESLIKTASGTPDLLVSASANVARFGQRLVRLVETICRGASASSSQVSNPSIGGSRLAASSINLPKLEALSSRQRTSLFSAALYALSHPASVAHINSAWLNLIRILNLPQHADVEPTFTEDESAPVFEKVVDTLVKLPKLDVAHRLMLQRLLQWAPVKAGSCLARKLHSDLLKPEYLDVTLDEVGIMLTPPGLLHNQALLASLPRYQMNKTNVKRESKLYSHEIEMEILEAQAAKKRQKQTTADGEQSFLESIAPQLTVKQLELVKAEMEKEEVIRLRIAKLYAVGSHKMDLLTILHDTLLRCSNVEGIQLAFLQRNSFALCDLTTRLLACPLLSPLAIGAHSRLARLIAEVAMRASVVDRTELCRKAFLFAAWSIRILGPARVCLEEKPPVASFCQTSSVDEQSVRAENAAWNAFSRIGDIKDQTELVLESLLSDLPSATVSSALLISAAVPMFIRILHNNTLFTSVENEEKKWADVYIFSKFIAALKKQVAFHDSVGKSSESYESVCASLQFQRIYEFSLDLIDEIGQALESSLVGEDSGLSASICELLQSTTQLHTEYFLHILESGHTQKDSLLVACTPTIYTLLERLVSFTPLTRATAMTV